MRIHLSHLVLSLAAICVAPAQVGVPAFVEMKPGSTNLTSRQFRTAPVDSFRGLLALPRPQREQALAQTPEQSRHLLLAKLDEYESLTPDEREVRLRRMQLRWHLLGLMRAPATERAQRLAGVPESDRPLVEERLREWDKLAPQAQGELLENQFTIDYFSRLIAGTAAYQHNVLDGLGPERRAEAEAGFARWNALPGEQRDRLHRQFQQFFELSEREQEKIVATLPQNSRTEMQKTLEALEKLPADQRQRCLDALRKFTSMSPVEREQFLRNAERWQAMSPVQRENWRSLVSQLPPEPPLPPGFIPNASASVTAPLPR